MNKWSPNETVFLRKLGKMSGNVYTVNDSTVNKYIFK